MIPRKPKINVTTLGCSKNLVDSEKLMGKLWARGLEVIHDGPPDSAPIAIINTCGFILDAKNESIDTIFTFVAAKQKGLIRKLFVMGCLSQRYRAELATEIPEVDAFFGLGDVDELGRSIVSDWQDLPAQRLVTTPPHYAYLKISEGCNRRCSFCAIPNIRGVHQSVPIDELVEEARNLVLNGAKEIICIAQDLSSYGRDLYGKSRLRDLSTQLVALPGLRWLRLHYAYPAGFPSELLETIAREPKICRYLDLPIQHIHDGVLRKMRRGLSADRTKALLWKIREAVPGIHIRTTLLVGHPGESEEAFLQLCDFVREFKFERLGVFTYSEEEGTWGAARLKDQVPENVKRERLEEIMAIQERISADLNAAKVGKTLEVLIDRKEGAFFVGRTEFDSPEVDGEVLIPENQGIEPGSIYPVLITQSDAFDLYGEVVQP